jgi:hypothetical protein
VYAHGVVRGFSCRSGVFLVSEGVLVSERVRVGVCARGVVRCLSGCSGVWVVSVWLVPCRAFIVSFGVPVLVVCRGVGCMSGCSGVNLAAVLGMLVVVLIALLVVDLCGCGVWRRGSGVFVWR